MVRQPFRHAVRRLDLHLLAISSDIEQVQVNGADVAWPADPRAVSRLMFALSTAAWRTTNICIVWKGGLFNETGSGVHLPG